MFPSVSGSDMSLLPEPGPWQQEAVGKVIRNRGSGKNESSQRNWSRLAGTVVGWITVEFVPGRSSLGALVCCVPQYLRCSLKKKKKPNILGAELKDGALF
jgi:hypothetical protein